MDRIQSLTEPLPITDPYTRSRCDQREQLVEKYLAAVKIYRKADTPELEQTSRLIFGLRRNELRDHIREHGCWERAAGARDRTLTAQNNGS
jgi:hypothetical protein